MNYKLLEYLDANNYQYQIVNKMIDIDRSAISVEKFDKLIKFLDNKDELLNRLEEKDISDQ